MSDFPSFDLAAFEAAHQDARHDMTRALDRICRNTGFLLLQGHGIDAAVIDDVWQAAAAFFAQGADIKHGVACLLYTSPSPRDQRGARMPSSA